MGKSPTLGFDTTTTLSVRAGFIWCQPFFSSRKRKKEGGCLTKQSSFLQERSKVGQRSEVRQSSWAETKERETVSRQIKKSGCMISVTGEFTFIAVWYIFLDHILWTLITLLSYKLQTCTTGCPEPILHFWMGLKWQLYIFNVKKQDSWRILTFHHLIQKIS